MRKISAVLVGLLLAGEVIAQGVVVSVPQPVTTTSLPTIVSTPSGSYLIVPNYISGGVAAVVQTSQPRK